MCEWFYASMCANEWWANEIKYISYGTHEHIKVWMREREKEYKNPKYVVCKFRF